MEKVLVIDDDRISRELLARTVERLGYIAIQSGNGRHGWETLWENSDIRFIVTDMIMPDMDGRELIHLIRKDENLRHIPVIIISGCLNAEDIQPIIAISPNRTLFMEKPLNTKLLEKHIESIKSFKPNSNSMAVVTN